MNKYQIWTEGYAATCESSRARYHGTYEGVTFKDAVAVFRDSLDDPTLVSMEKMTYWGCSFFENGADAQKSFG